MELLPLKSLIFSSSNVRKTDIGKGLEELTASIRTHGLLQNLTVVSINDNKFEVIAGQRRLRAIKFLFKAGEWPADRLIPCEIVDKEQAAEISLAENVIREPMHPADQFQAYATLVDNGMTVGDIATHFGVAESQVTKLLKLGRLSPKLMKLYRNSELSLEVLMAFTLTDDHNRQMEVYNRFKGSWQLEQAHYIRQALTETMVSGNSKFARFVGLEAYEQAGGTFRRDLFSDNHDCYLENPELLQQLLEAKLQHHAEALQKEWKWVEIQPELDYTERAKYHRLYAHPLEVPEALLQQQASLEKQFDETPPDDEHEAEARRINQDLQEISNHIAAYHGFSMEERALAGCIISISYLGEIEIHQGLVRPEDRKALEKDSSGNSEAKTEAKTTHSYSQALMEKLKNYRLQVIRQHLAEDYETAFDAALYLMCVKHFHHRSYGKDWLSLRTEKYYLPSTLLTDDETCAALQQAEEAQLANLPLAWLNIENEIERFQAFCTLDTLQKHALFAACTARALQPQLSIEINKACLFEVIAGRLTVDIEKHWRPTASNFLNHITKKELLELGQSIFGDEWAKSYAKPPKAEVVNFLHEAFANPNQSKFTLAQQAMLEEWLPEGMACPFHNQAVDIKQ